MKRRALHSLLVGAVVLACLVVPVAALGPPGSPQPSHAAASATVAEQNASNPANRGIRIAVRPNGSGVVTVRYRIPLAGANETAAFERLRANITANASWYRTRFGARMSQVVASAQAATGRKMTATNVTVNATRRGTTGIVTYSFVWTGFAATEDDRILIGDALTGFYLENGTRLTVAWPAAYEPTAIRPPPDDRRPRSVAWSASTEFGENEPFVELGPAASTADPRNRTAESNAPGGAAGRTTTVASPEPNTTGSNGSKAIDDGRAGTTGGNGSNATRGGSNVGLPTTVAVVGALLVVVALAVWLMSRQNGDDRSVTDVSAATSADANGGEPPDSAGDEATDPELLSNEERVVRVLERAGGRAKQQHVVEELGWTEAKTSQVVSDLREEGTITGFRLGRENVLAIPDADDGEDAGE